MPDLRCKCGTKIAEYDDVEVRIKHRRCGGITILRVVNGKLREIKCCSEDWMHCSCYRMCIMLYGKCKWENKGEVQDAQ
jgi:hypothetical protein